MQRAIRVYALAVICLLSAVGLFAQTKQSYLLRSDGDVRVNGIAVPSTTIVSPGDVIETSKGSVAKIAAPGASTLIGENSRVSVKTGTLAVDHLSAASSSNTALSDGSAIDFQQLSAESTSRVCRTAALCYCRTSKNCRKTIR